jgi:hypothetical protein
MTLNLSPNGQGPTQTAPTVTDPGYYKFVDSVLNANKGLNFVQRIRNPAEKLDLGNGQYATHRMAYDPDTKRAYPTVVKQGNKLVELKGDEAWDYADKTGEYIAFNTAKDAERFANNGYKIVWNNQDNPFLKKKTFINIKKSK